MVLDKVDNINDNTKQFRFKFDNPDAVSGLSVASALITKYKGPEDEKPTIRPYTPTSDEGKLMKDDYHVRTRSDVLCRRERLHGLDREEVPEWSDV